MTYTLITGASAGIGKALAEECARRNHNLILISSNVHRLEKTVRYLASSYPVEIKQYTQDLTLADAPENIYHWCQANQLKVNMLINNVGIGHKGSFENTTIEFYQKMMVFHTQLIISLTKLFMPDLKACHQSYILNVASLSAFFPVPYKSVYAASKSFILSFSLALRRELKNTSANVSCLCPSGVTTNEAVIQRIEAAGVMGKITRMTPEKVAAIAVKGLLKNKAIIIPGILNRVIAFIAWILPYAAILKLGEHYMQKPSDSEQ